MLSAFTSEIIRDILQSNFISFKKVPRFVVEYFSSQFLIRLSKCSDQGTDFNKI